MRAICISLFVMGAVLLSPAAATPSIASGPVFAQATATDQATAKKPKAKRKRAPKVEYMRAVPSR
jgi:hypothetical protein